MLNSHKCPTWALLVHRLVQFTTRSFTETALGLSPSEPTVKTAYCYHTYVSFMAGKGVILTTRLKQVACPPKQASLASQTAPTAAFSSIFVFILKELNAAVGAVRYRDY